MTDELTIEDVERVITLRDSIVPEDMAECHAFISEHGDALLSIARAHIEAKDGDVGELVYRLAGPHEWGYRDPVEGGFVSDPTPFRAADLLTAQQSTLAARDAKMPLSDVNSLDAVVHALGIEDSNTTPAEAVASLQAQLAATVSQRDEWQAIATAREAKGGDAGELANKLRQHVIASDGSALYPGGLDGTRELILSAADALAAKEAEIAGLREALEPFAKIANLYDDAEDGNHKIWMDCAASEIGELTVDNVRRARAATGKGEAK